MHLALVGFALLVLGIIVGAAGGSTAVTFAGLLKTRGCFVKPLATRIGGTIMGLGLLPLPLVFAGTDKGMMAFYFLLCVPTALLILVISRPSELRLNLVERTYRWVRGWPLLSSVQSGPLTDMWGIYVRTSGGKGDIKASYFVGVRSRRFSSQISLGYFEVQAAAERFAEELMGRTRFATCSILVAFINMNAAHRSSGQGIYPSSLRMSLGS